MLDSMFLDLVLLFHMNLRPDPPNDGYAWSQFDDLRDPACWRIWIGIR